MNPNHKPLTERERKVASVAADLLMKGSPATRIAKYAIEQGMNADQIRTLMQKLNLSARGLHLSDEVNHNRWYLEGGFLDPYQEMGNHLKGRLEYTDPKGLVNESV